MNIQKANVEALANLLTAAALTTIPALNIYRDFENAVGSTDEDQTTSVRALPCVIVSCDDPKENIPYTLQFMSHPTIEVQASADDATDTEFSAMVKEVGSALFASETLSLSQRLSAALSPFYSQYARIVSQSTGRQDRRWIARIQLEMLSCQADSGE